MALKAAMLCTCGLTAEEFTGRAAHDLASFGKHIRNAEAATHEQQRSQSLPASQEDLNWLRQAYLEARYPNASSASVPANRYTDTDSIRAIKLAEEECEEAREHGDKAQLAWHRRTWCPW